MKQDEKNTKTEIFGCHEISGFPFLSFLKYPFNYLTGKQFQTVAVKNCSRSANVNQKQEKSHYGPTGK